MSNNQINWAALIVMQTKHGLVVAEGSPGTGKTAITNLIAKTLGLDGTQTMLLGQMPPEDILGIPLKSTVTFGGVTRECVKYVQSEQMLKFKHGNYLTLIDECNHASRATQAAAQEELFNAQPAGMAIAIANPAELATDAYEFSAPVINRMCKLKWETSLSNWQQGMETNQFPEPSIPVLPADWESLIPKWKFMVSKFSQEGGGEFFVDGAVVPVESKDQSKPWCSLRSWTNAAVNLAAAESVNANEDTCRKILEGFVGVNAATVFLHWTKSTGLPTASDFYHRPSETCHRLPRRFDTAVACVKGVVYYTKQQIDEASSPYESGRAWEKGLDFADQAFAHNREVVTASVSSFLKLKPASHQPESRSSDLWDTLNGIRQESMNVSQAV